MQRGPLQLVHCTLRDYINNNIILLGTHGFYVYRNKLHAPALDLCVEIRKRSTGYIVIIMFSTDIWE